MFTTPISVTFAERFVAGRVYAPRLVPLPTHPSRPAGFRAGVSRGGLGLGRTLPIGCR